MNVAIVDDPADLTILVGDFNKALHLLGSELVKCVELRDNGMRRREAPAFA